MPKFKSKDLAPDNNPPQNFPNISIISPHFTEIIGL